MEKNNMTKQSYLEFLPQLIGRNLKEIKSSKAKLRSKEIPGKFISQFYSMIVPRLFYIRQYFQRVTRLSNSIILVIEEIVFIEFIKKKQDKTP